MIKFAIIALLIPTVLISELSAQTRADPEHNPGSVLRAPRALDGLASLPELLEAPLPDVMPPEDQNVSVLPVDGVDRSVVSEPLTWSEPVAEPVFYSDGFDEASFDSTFSNEVACDQAACVDDSCGACCGSPKVSHQWTPWQHLPCPKIPDNLDCLMIGANFRKCRVRDRGIGYERVMYAPNVLDTAVLTPHVGVRYQLDFGLQTPDRAEYYWGLRPQRETGLNAQDLSVRLALGNEKIMALTEYTMRSLDPEVNENTTGFGDLVVGAQAMLVDGKRTKVATIFRAFQPTGPVDRGLGTGNNSLEYGLLARHCLRPETYLHTEVKYWMPLKGTAGIAGDVLTTGWGISTIATESDVFAVLPTLEIRTLSFLFGGQNAVSADDFERIDGITAVEIYPGARFVLGPASDLGLSEFGFAAGVTAADSEWFDARLVFDMRISF